MPRRRQEQTQNEPENPKLEPERSGTPKPATKIPQTGENIPNPERKTPNPPDPAQKTRADTKRAQNPELDLKRCKRTRTGPERLQLPPQKPKPTRPPEAFRNGRKGLEMAGKYKKWRKPIKLVIKHQNRQESAKTGGKTLKMAKSSSNGRKTSKNGGIAPKTAGKHQKWGENLPE